MDIQFLFEKTERMLPRIEPYIKKNIIPVKEFLKKECGYKKDNVLPKIDSSWEQAEGIYPWNRLKNTHAWFYAKVNAPYDNMYFAIDTDKARWDDVYPQIIVYVNGKIVQGMDPYHREVQLGKKGEYEIYLYAYAGGKRDSGIFEMSFCLYNEDEAVKKLYYDLKIPFDITQIVYESSGEYASLVTTLSDAVDCLDFRHPYTDPFYKSIEKATDVLEKGLSKRCKQKNDVNVVCIGHTHIDVAWLWTFGQTKEKVQRSFSTVIHLMKKYPEYKFMSSQAQLYKYLKEEAPEVYKEVKKYVREGRWEVEGAMWVEADCNLTSGESLVRQVMFGKRFFKEEFGIDSKMLWLPDVFGYSGALPQILVKSGVDTFVTSKISWNDRNTMPSDTLMWEGIDGTKIFSYFITPPAYYKGRGDTPSRLTRYCAFLTPMQVEGTWARYNSKDISDEVLHPFGYGDGGGGPTAHMLETQRRLSKGIAGCPTTSIDTATNFIKRLKKEALGNKHLTTWVGEFYLENHRMTLTTQHKNKKNNRRTEFMYQAAELLSSMEMVFSGKKYPQAELNRQWEDILVMQFHDVLPGSSIREVYEDTDRMYAEVMKYGQSVIDDNIKSLSSKIKTDGGLLVFNPLSFTNSGIVEKDGKSVYVENIPAKGWNVVDYKETNTIKATENLIENKFFKVKIKNGDIISVYDKKNSRELLQKGKKLNNFVVYHNLDENLDAWEIRDYYKDRAYEITEFGGIRVIEDGVKKGVEIINKYETSTIIQKVWLIEDIARIDLETTVDWHEDHLILKERMPFDIHTNKATCDIQFGSIERPTHKNTSWDAAKFEICAQKYIDLSEDDYGVSVLSDSKYGYDVAGGEIGLSILKTSCFPDVTADRGEQTFTYSIYPHKGNHTNGGTVQMAYNLNVPMTAVETGKQNGTLPESYSFITSDCENVIVDTVKKAEDSDELVVRLYETYNRRGKATIKFGFDVQKVNLSDLCENKTKEIKVKNNSVTLDFKPFEIITLVVKTEK